MTNTTAANGKEAADHGVPAEDGYGYAQAIKIGNMIYVSGRLSQDDKGGGSCLLREWQAMNEISSMASE